MSDPASWDVGLLRRYATTETCYTSYPAPAQFSEGVQSTDLFAALHDSGIQRRPLSLYVHIPFCANICYYCACTKTITKDRSRAQAYLQALIREIELVSVHLEQGQRVERLHFGGGTPTFLGHDDLRRLMGTLRAYFNLHDDDIADYSIEIDPREADWSTIGLLRELGFNRISIGVQDLDPEVQRAINRLQSVEQTQAVMDAARTLAYRTVGVDLIHGLPRQTPQSFSRTLATVIEMRPDQLRLYSYRHLPEVFLSQRKINPLELPGTEDCLQMQADSFAQLMAAGYHYLGMGEFALSDTALSNAQESGELGRGLQGYVTAVDGDLIGLGVSAISQVGDFYCRNTSDLRLYQSHLEQDRLALQSGLTCSTDDRLRRAVIAQLACHHRLRFADIEQRFRIDFCAYFADRMALLQQMHRDGLLQLQPAGISVLPAGRPLVGSICRLFDAYAYLPQHPQSVPAIVG